MLAFASLSAVSFLPIPMSAEIHLRIICIISNLSNYFLGYLLLYLEWPLTIWEDHNHYIAIVYLFSSSCRGWKMTFTIASMLYLLSYFQSVTSNLGNLLTQRQLFRAMFRPFSIQIENMTLYISTVNSHPIILYLLVFFSIGGKKKNTDEYTPASVFPFPSYDLSMYILSHSVAG